MKFALNYSPQAMTLLTDGVIDIDLFKVSSDFPEHIPLCKEVKPVTIHFSLIAGAGNLEPNFGMIEQMLSETDTKFVNVHLGATGEDYPDIDPESSDENDRQRLVNEMLNDVKVMTSHFGAENIILENWPYHARMRNDKDILNVVVDPKTISEVITETGCGILFDIDHAVAAADARGEELIEYVSQLPVKHMKELHMTGSIMQEGWMRSHLEMKESDWDIFDWALGEIDSGSWSHPEIMAFEYGGVGPAFEWRSDAKVIAQQVPKFMEKIANLGQH